MSVEVEYSDFKTWDDGTLDASQKKVDNGTLGVDEKLPQVGNTADLNVPGWTNAIGASKLGAVWQDPHFDPTRQAAYRSRVVENLARDGHLTTGSTAIWAYRTFFR
ncbi:MAG: DUF3604 domain-containing protein [Roseobacter sp.]